jgi:hypothetical protein
VERKKTDIEYTLMDVSWYAKEGLNENDLADVRKMIGCKITEYIEDANGDKLYILSDNKPCYGEYLVLDPEIIYNT